MCQMDVNCAILNASLDEEVYVSQLVLRKKAKRIKCTNCIRHGIDSNKHQEFGIRVLMVS